MAEQVQLVTAALAVDSPGVYNVIKEAVLTSGPGKASGTIQRLKPGEAVVILEVLHEKEDNRVRGRVQEPAGWISLVDPDDASKRWAVRDLMRSNRWATSQVEQLEVLKRERDAAKESAKETASASAGATVSDDNAHEELQAKAAEDRARMERAMQELRDQNQKLETSCKELALQVDSPGSYLMVNGVDVTAGPEKASEKVHRLLAGEELEVLEVVHRKLERRVRGRIERPVAGWVSLLDTVEGHRWAERQLLATTNWIHNLRASTSAVVPVSSTASAKGSLELLTELDTTHAKIKTLEAERDRFQLEAASAKAKAVHQQTPETSLSASSELRELKATMARLTAEHEERQKALECERDGFKLDANMAKAECERVRAVQQKLLKASPDASAELRELKAKLATLQAEGQDRHQALEAERDDFKRKAEMAKADSERMQAVQQRLQREMVDLRAEVVASRDEAQPRAAAAAATELADLQAKVEQLEVEKMQAEQWRLRHEALAADHEDIKLRFEDAKAAAASAASHRGDVAAARPSRSSSTAKAVQALLSNVSRRADCRLFWTSAVIIVLFCVVNGRWLLLTDLVLFFLAGWLLLGACEVAEIQHSSKPQTSILSNPVDVPELPSTRPAVVEVPILPATAVPLQPAVTPTVVPGMVEVPEMADALCCFCEVMPTGQFKRLECGPVAHSACLLGYYHDRVRGLLRLDGIPNPVGMDGTLTAKDLDNVVTAQERRRAEGTVREVQEANQRLLESQTDEHQPAMLENPGFTGSINGDFNDDDQALTAALLASQAIM